MTPLCCVQGPYVLFLVSLAGGTRNNKIQTGLLVSAYRSLSRPFRKNVKYIILVRPSKPLKALLSFLKPFVSRKAHRKVLKVRLEGGCPAPLHPRAAHLISQFHMCTVDAAMPS